MGALQPASRDAVLFALLQKREDGDSRARAKKKIVTYFDTTNKRPIGYGPWEPLTYELPVGDSIKFLDVKIEFLSNRVRWSLLVRAENKQLLFHGSTLEC